jgi:hypothetical protein
VLACGWMVNVSIPHYTCQIIGPNFVKEWYTTLFQIRDM